MKTKLDLITKYISNRIREKYPKFIQFTIEINKESLYLEHRTLGFSRRLFVGLGVISYPKSMIVSGGYQCWLEVSEVEEILHNLKIKHNIHYQELNPTIRFDTYTDSKCDEVWNSFKKYRDIDLATNPEVLDALCDHYIEVIGKHFIPFWEKYSNLQYINDEIIDKVPDNQIHHYLSGMTPFKKLIIMRICNNKDYEIFKEEILERGFNAIKEDSFRYTPYQNVLIDTIEIIESRY
jgi:hypothetical protein